MDDSAWLKIVSISVFAFFVASGFCGLTYEVIWMRIAMARFGVTTPIVSFTLSIFMAGLGFGSLLAARWIQNRKQKSAQYFLRAYSITELVIACSSITVPFLLQIGHNLLLSSNQEFSSISYHFASGAIITVCMLPWCMFMGATF